MECVERQKLFGHELVSMLGGEQSARDFLDPILCGLLMAQSAWLATRDPATLRRELLRVLASLG